MRVLFVSDTHLGFDLPSRPRVVRRRRGDDFFQNFERALEPARTGEVDVVVHGGDLLYRSRVPAWLAEAALAPLKRLAESGVPVLLVPGNHERSRMPFPLLAVHDRLHVFDRPRTLVLEARGVRVAFMGFPYTHDIRRRFPEILAGLNRHDLSAHVRVLCLHQCIEGATCGPGNFTFRFGPDVIRTADLPRNVVVGLSGHIHRHQVLQPAGGPPIIYAGSIERTSFAEAPETKGFVVLELARSGLSAFEFRPLPARPMIIRRVSFGDSDAMTVHTRLAAAIESTPGNAVVQLRVTGQIPSTLTAATLRAVAGARTVTLAIRTTDRRTGSFAGKTSDQSLANGFEAPPGAEVRSRRSDRLYRIAQQAGQAVSVFGAEDEATAWLKRPNRALHGELPFRLLDTDVGAREVEDPLARIEHGIVGQCAAAIANDSRSYHDSMPEQRLLTVGVECYAGHRGEQTPRALILGDRRIGVAEVLDAWLAPDHRYFKLRGADGGTYLVRHDERSNTWELTLFRAEHA